MSCKGGPNTSNDFCSCIIVCVASGPHTLALQTAAERQTALTPIGSSETHWNAFCVQYTIYSLMRIYSRPYLQRKYNTMSMHGSWVSGAIINLFTILSVIISVIHFCFFLLSFSISVHLNFFDTFVHISRFNNRISFCSGDVVFSAL